MVSLTQSPLLNALGWALLNSLWQMGLLWLVYHGLTAIFYKTAARIRYGLALLLLLSGTAWWIQTFIAACRPTAAPFDTAVLTTASPAPEGFWTHLLRTVHNGLLAALPFASTLYLALLFILLFRYIRRYLAVQTLLQSDYVHPSLSLQEFVKDTARRMRIRPTVRLWLSSRIDTPITLGFLRPVILLPAAILSQLTLQQVEAILVHELAHIRRKDYLVHLIITLLEGLLFFNPFCRLLIHYLKKERELCCDDYVLQYQYDAHSYVSALLSLATAQQQTQLAIAANGGDGQLLLQRAKRLLQQPQKPQGPGLRTLILLLLLTTTTILITRPLQSKKYTGAPSPAITATKTIPPSLSGTSAEWQEVPFVQPPAYRPPVNTYASPEPPIIPAAPRRMRTQRQRSAQQPAGIAEQPREEITIVDLDSLQLVRIAQVQQMVLVEMETELKDAQRQLDQRAAILRSLSDKKANGLQMEVTFEPQQQLIQLQKKALEQQRKTLKIYQQRVEQLQKKFKQTTVIRIVYI